MQNAETRSLTLKVGKNEELEPCRCEACFSRRDLDHFRSVCSVPRPRGLYTNARDARLGSSQIPIAPYPLVSEYPAPSRTSLYPAHYNLHRPASYSRAFYFPAGPESRIYDLPRMKEMPREESTPHETRLVQSQLPQMRLNLETSNQASGSSEKPRRMRTVFTPQQLERLELHFTCQQYVGGPQRLYIAKQLGLSETQVKVWFQNRRIRWRKQVLSSAVTSSQS